MATIGYVRVSSDKQTLEHQHYEIVQYALKNDFKIDRWVEEKISSRQELKKRKFYVKPGVERKLKKEEGIKNSHKRNRG